MFTGFLHTHSLASALYILLMLTFSFFIISGNSRGTDWLDSKTRIARIILGIIIAGTGGYLITNPAIGSDDIWLWVKIGIVLAGIGVGAVGVKRRKGALTAVSAFLFLYVYGVSETRSLTFSPDAPEMTEDMTARAYYEQNCVSCHGAEGDKMAAGAKNLQSSELSDEEIKTIIKNGKNSMRAYKNLSDQDMEKLVEYVKSLRN